MSEQGAHSLYGRWIEADHLPAFAYSADHTQIPEAEWDTGSAGRTRRHWVGVGNRRIQLFVDNEGTAAVFDESHGIRWLTAPDPCGTGLSRVRAAGESWSTYFPERPKGSSLLRIFGPTWFRVEAESTTLKLERTILCPEGEWPWVLVRVRLVSRSDSRLYLRHSEEWALRPRFLNLGVATAVTPEDQQKIREDAQRIIGYRIDTAVGSVRATEERIADPERIIRALDGTRVRLPVVFGPPLSLFLESVGDTVAAACHDGAPHPTLSLVSELELDAGEGRDLWFRFGVDDGSACPNPESLYSTSLQRLKVRLPRASSGSGPKAAREIPWHAALLTGTACVDSVLGGHTLDQGSAYSFQLGFNGAARDPLQHALPLVYFEPDLALSVLRNTASWGSPSGKIPWCIDGAKASRPGNTPDLTNHYRNPSDIGMWALWLASEYAAATGNLAAFDKPLEFHPLHRAPAAALKEHLRRHFRHLVDSVKLGAHGHLRVLDCDWADGHLGEIQRLGLERSVVITEGESILNSAMAAWILPVYAGLCERLDDAATAREARGFGERLRQRVAAEWNGRWFNRARCRDIVVGIDTLFLEVQPWAILCGAADGSQTKMLLKMIDAHLRNRSPLGARQRWPVPNETVHSGAPGEALAGGIWPSLQTILIWAAVRHDPTLAWDEWNRFTLGNHTAHYPGVWEGTLSGPDSYNAPESASPGRTWAFTTLSMQQFPVNNLHCHAQPMLAYLRLLGVEPLADGSLSVRGGAGSFTSQTFELDTEGHGRIAALGPVRLQTRFGEVAGRDEKLRW